MWKVLIVEDERHAREYVKEIVNWEDQGFTLIGEVSNGLDALKFMDRHEPDLIISDIIMPHMDGVELLKTLRLRGYDGIFIMLTCIDEFEYARQAVEGGASSYMLKLSMGPDLLQEKLEKANRELWKRERLRRLNQIAPDVNRFAEEHRTDHTEINKILSYIRKNFQLSITLQSMSEYVNLTPSYLSDLFKKKTGETLIHYLHRVRVGEAQMLLTSTTLSIEQIANLVGFEDVNYFIRVFKRINEVTPAAYRGHPQ